MNANLISHKKESFFLDIKKIENDKKRLLNLVNNKLLSNRILYHQNTKSKLHLMMICHHRNNKIYPLKFKKKKKFFVHLGGRAIFKFYDHKNKLVKKLNFNNKNNFIFLDENKYYYKQSVLSDKLIFFELTSGPFISKDKMYLYNK
jgi:cupin fold WbuC family metalloprotein